ncbi:ABC transporter ATP-binding protein [Sinomonas sp. ASV486]|uniref:ABC transporter ATP-binding protein n=1 Tax=Sinomonas sp. ASV486 TaxID=3051170 RepID=UPI0027DC5572|nr:ABC transporter ATP-binding protein [Sinomonas sp. ASV486]MDQ4489802.1 ABC transporter ATP-binding protein [Sinomonas sp. ASV486]
MLTVEDLNVDYTTRSGTKRVVHNMGFAIEDGQMVGLVGESGSGKSAAMHAVAGLPRSVKATITGRVTLDSKDVLTASSREMKKVHGPVLGFIGQNPFGCLHPIQSIEKQFHLILTTHGRSHSRAQTRELALAALDSVGIPNPQRVLSGHAHQLSGGMAQRVVIAMATVLKPRLLIADEPTTALDPTVQIQILEVLTELRQTQNVAVLVVTHDLGIVANYCQQVLVMKDGRLVEQGGVQKLFTAPEHPYTRELLLETAGATS